MSHIAVYQQQLEFLFAKKWQIGKILEQGATIHSTHKSR
jgi:hypothetical protein